MPDKYCSYCKRSKPTENFSKNKSQCDGFEVYCRVCRQTYRDTDKVKANNRRINKEIRRKVLSHYGSKCACCGENHIEFLAIDHIKGGGTKERLASGGGSVNVYRRVISENYPADKYRVLCHNCNMSIGHYGYCPHKDINNA